MGILLLALMLGLGALGVTHAHWVQISYIGATATIGEGDLGFTTEQCEFFQYYGTSDTDYGCTCNFTDSDGDGDLDVMEATITGLDPSCGYKLYSTISNNGTLPMRIDDVQIQNPNPGQVTISEEVTLVGTQVDPGDTETCKLLIETEDAPPDPYSFSVNLTSCLWNE